MKHLFFHIAEKNTDSGGRYTMAAVCRTGGGYPLAQGEAQKYMLDIVAHALSFSQGGLEPDALQCADQGYLLASDGDYILVGRQSVKPDALQCADQGYLLASDGDYILVGRQSVKPVGLECADMGNLLAGGDYLLVKT